MVVMRLMAKFTAIFTLVFFAGVAIIAWLSYRLVEENARTLVLDQARLMMQAARSVRDYTTFQLKPLLTPEEKRDHTFLPQRVPAYAATEHFKYLHEGLRDYTYKEASLNPTNPRDRAVDWEADIINAFRDKPETQELTGERDASTGKSLFFARPIRVERECLECHSQPSVAPPAMIQIYGASNGFGWQPGAVIAAQIVSVPMALPLTMARDSFRRQLLYLAIVFFASLLVLNIVLYFMIARPVARLSDMADRISLGEVGVAELPVRGHDEIARLAGSFNRMRRSLAAAMRMLNDSDTNSGTRA
jgi:HAMP domain-containing protein